jgi:hypothetical protein
MGRSDDDLLDFVQIDLIPGLVVQLRRRRRLVNRYLTMGEYRRLWEIPNGKSLASAVPATAQSSVRADVGLIVFSEKSILDRDG